ncbi:MAG: PD-(D/E)XK nuclease family transposase [Lachnospiraceae bacterium]|nr:PD-(D/E)XK nuclease family transposase [Lachnospiraceae bacterium]
MNERPKPEKPDSTFDSKESFHLPVPERNTVANSDHNTSGDGHRANSHQQLSEQITVASSSIPASARNPKSYTYRPLSELNVIDNFLFTTLLTRDDTKEQVALLILNNILDKQIRHVTVHAQREYPGMDTDLHGIRLDVSITDDDDAATIYDLEPDNKKQDADILSKRNRYYTAMIDSRDLQSGGNYDKVRNLVIIMILSYDPFGAGDLYYEAGTTLKTHPEIPYDDGIRRIYLYGDGNINLAGNAGERLQAMVRYICHSDYEHVVNKETAAMDEIVRRVKVNEEVSVVYLRAIEREQELKQEGREEGLKEGREEGRIDALKKIMKSFNVSAEQAMDSLEIPVANREQYLALLK